MATRRNIKVFVNEREVNQPQAGGHQGIKPNAADEKGYSVLGDTRLRSLALNFGVLVMIVLLSGKTMEYIVDNYLIGPS